MGNTPGNSKEVKRNNELEEFMKKREKSKEIMRNLHGKRKGDTMTKEPFGYYPVRAEIETEENINEE